ncbi:MAG: hypothetical protein QG635_2322, partial [Bacteroidota bacterium]|nr:hypothetical protein [Bacteroidota bacterium]
WQRRAEDGRLTEYQVGRTNHNPEIVIGSNQIVSFLKNADVNTYKLNLLDNITNNPEIKEKLLFGDPKEALASLWIEELTNPLNWIVGAGTYIKATEKLIIKGALTNKVKAPKPTPKFRTTTNQPQLPPSTMAPGYNVRVMPPTEQYPNGYWVISKEFAPGKWQPINPSTGKPGPRWETHVPLPKKY